MNVALLQTDIIWEDRRANLKRVEKLIDKLPSSVELLVLPEMFDTGFSMHPERFAEDEQGESIPWLLYMAKTYNIAIICSIMYVHLKQYFNRLFFIFPDGSYKKYDKKHLFSYGIEHEHYKAGTERLLVDYSGWKICPLVCYDLRFPVWSRNVGLSYDILIYVANWPTVRRKAWNALLQARAIENQCYVLGVNRVSPKGETKKEQNYSGDSQIIDFMGDTVIKATDYSEEFIIADLDMKSLQQFRNDFPAWKDADKFSIYE
jgi:predicted amidohydrolase